MRRLFAFLCVCIVLAAASAGHAGIKPGTFSLTPVVGGYTFEGNQNLKTAPLIGLRAGYDFTKNCGLEGVFHYVPTELKNAGNGDVDAFTLRAEALYHLLPEGNLVPFVAAGVGGQRLSYPAGFDSRTRAEIDYGIGLKYFLSESLALRADVRHVITFDRRFNNLEYTVGLGFLFGGAAPARAAAAPPPPPRPKPKPKPAVAPPPPAPPADSDHDGVPDDRDKCPGTAKGVPVDKGGCPLPEKISIRLVIEFDTNKSDIKPKYHDEIARVGDFMKKYPKTTAVIEGHTDNVGGKAYNDRLSQRRAESVRKYLIEKFGIAPARLTAKGYGSSKPVADNATAEGRQKNRRIEASITTVAVKK